MFLNFEHFIPYFLAYVLLFMQLFLLKYFVDQTVPSGGV